MGEDRQALTTRELPRFALLAQAVAGRRLLVVRADGPRSYTDGAAVFLADLQEPGLRASLVLQAGLLAAGSLEPGVMARLTGKRLQRLRYLTLEAGRAADSLSDVIPARATMLLREVYDGPLPGSAQESLAWAGTPRRHVPEAPEWLGTVKPIRVMRGSPLGGGEPTARDREGAELEQALRELDDEEESERSRILELFSAPIRNPLAAMVQKFFGMGRAPGLGAGGAELRVGGATRGPVGPGARPAQPRPDLAPEPGGVPAGRRYPEWDFRRGRYRHDWCAVAEFDPPALPAGEAHVQIPTADRALRRQLAALGLSHQRHRRQADGDSIDLTALVELLVDRAAGHPGDPRVYEIKRRTARDLGVLVLLDATGSTGESAEGRKVFDEQRLLAARLTAALEELGDRVATYAFYSRGREAVRFLRVKDFDDRYDHAAQRRLRSLVPGGYTRLGAAIRHGTHLVTSRAGTSMMLLALVGDGLPYEDGYEHRYAQEDSRRALLEAVAGGVGCACVSVRASTGDDVLRRVWGGVPYRRLDDASTLAGHARPLFAQALRAATASRRPGGRPAFMSASGR